MDNDILPLIRVAALCENTIEDKRDGTLSIVKLIDILTIKAISAMGGPVPEKMQPAQFLVRAVIGTVAGEARGDRTLTLQLEFPDGSVRDLKVGTGLPAANYDSEVAARNWVVSLALTLSEPGTYWIRVQCNGKPFTRMPLQIAYEPHSTSEPSAP